MKTDVIVIGTELDGLIAALRLREYGHSVRIFANGAGSLHYAPGGFHLLGYLSSKQTNMVTSPFDEFSNLDLSHPYQKIGVDTVKQALSWYLNYFDESIDLNTHNQKMVSPAGQFIPVWGANKHHAMYKHLIGKKIALVSFNEHRDFPADLILTALNNSGFQVHKVEHDAPGTLFENVTIAKAFDALPDPAAYFSELGELLPESTEAIVFPSLLGLKKYQELILIAEKTLARPCMELPTLPPSVPGMRLERSLMGNLKKSKVSLHTGATLRQENDSSDQEIVLQDSMNRQYKSDLAIISNGGVLMGGIEVDSYGQINEPIFGLSTYQSQPLNTDTAINCLNALHSAGIETDEYLRPRENNGNPSKNLFITGRTLAHWNPSAENSNEGVCISTGWAAAENAHVYLKEKHNE